MGLNTRVVLLWCLLFFSGVWGVVDPSSASLQELPECAIACIETAAAQSPCALNDTACACTNVEYQTSVAQCVGSQCTIIEGLATKNITSTACQVPVRSRTRQHQVIGKTFAGLAILSVIIRFAFKIYAKLDLGLDDWFILATVVAIIPSIVFIEVGSTPNGLGKDIWTLTPKQITNYGMYFWMQALSYFLQIPLIKLSLLFFYLRIFPSRGVRHVLWGTVVFTSLYGIAFFLAALVHCQPISYFWTRWDGLHQGKCANFNAVSWANASISIALDFWMLAIPLWQLRKLQLGWKKKAGVALMFFVGTFVTVISIVRLHSLVVLSSSINITWDYFQVSLWSSIEVCIGILCACMPTLRLVLVRIFPKLGTTTNLSGSHAQYYGRHTGSRPARLSSHGAPELTANKSHLGRRERQAADRKGLPLHSRESDETRLVEMTPLPRTGNGRGGYPATG